MSEPTPKCDAALGYHEAVLANQRKLQPCRECGKMTDKGEICSEICSQSANDEDLLSLRESLREWVRRYGRDE